MSEEKKDTYNDARSRYNALKYATYDNLYQDWSAKLDNNGLRFESITKDALNYAEDKWDYEKYENLPALFPWRKACDGYKKNPRKFDMAIWDGSKLCGLVIGKASKGKEGFDTNVTINYLQGAPPDVNSLKGNVGTMSISAFYMYGYLLGKSNIYIREPVSGVKDYYRSLGFSCVVRPLKGVYMGKSIP